MKPLVPVLLYLLTRWRAARKETLPGACPNGEIECIIHLVEVPPMGEAATLTREEKEAEATPVSKEDRATLLILKAALEMLWQVHDDLQTSGIENPHLEQSIEGLEDCIDSIRLKYVVADPADAIPFAQVKAELGLEPS